MARAAPAHDRPFQPGPAAALAEQALAVALADPGGAPALALQARRAARAEGDAGARFLAELALGEAAKERSHSASLRHLRRAVQVAERAGLAGHAARARISLAGTLALHGDLAGAAREAELAEPVVRGGDLGRLLAQQAVIAYLQGRLGDTFALYRPALPILRRAGDALYEARVLNNRAMLHSYRGQLAAADEDLRRAEQLYRSIGMGRHAALVEQNLGFVAAFRGDLPAALAWFDRADAWFREHGSVDAIGLRDRCEALLPAGLVVGARRAAEQAVRHLAAEGRGSHLAEARLLLSEAALRDGDPASARAEAERAPRGVAPPPPP